LDALQAREERLGLVLQATNEGIWDWDIGEGRVYFSSRWHAMLGYEKGEIPGTFQGWQELVHPEDLSNAMEAVEGYLAGERPNFEMELRMRHKDGSYRWILTRGILVRDAEGDPVRMVGSHTDVTPRKEAEAAVQAQMAFENVVTAISTRFINLPLEEIDRGIGRALETVGRFMGVDRSYLFLFSGDGETMDCYHEWSAEGVEPQIERLQGVVVDDLAWTSAPLLRGEILHVPHVADMPPEARSDREEFERQGIRSLVAVPMVYQGTVVGFLGFDAVRQEKVWSKGSIKLLTIVGEIFVNALQHKRAQALQADQGAFFELLAAGRPLQETLNALIRLIEARSPGMLGLILMLDEDGCHLRYGASVSLPEEYVASIEGLEIGPRVGSCGSACYRGERVIVEDISADPRWQGLRDLALSYNLRACWSEPIVSSEGEVVGSFAMYYRQPRAPTEEELRVIETAADLAGIAIERRRSEEALRESQRTLSTLMSNLPGMAYRCLNDPDWTMEFVSEGALELTGYPPEELVGNRERTYGEIIHPEDRERVWKAVQEAVEKGEPFQFTYRIITADGSVKWVWEQGQGVYRSDGSAEAVEGFASDVTERMTAQQTLERRVHERTDELETLLAVQQAITSDLDRDAVLQMIAEEARRLTGGQRAVVLLCDEEGERLVVRFVAGENRPDLLGESIPVAGSLSGHSMLEGDSLLITNMQSDPRVDPEIVAQSPYLSQLSVPLLATSGPLGVIAVSDPEPDAFTSRDVNVLTMLASSAVIGLENARLYQEEQERLGEAERHRRVAEGLRDILAVLNSNCTFDEILDYIVFQASQLLGANAGVIYWADADSDRIRVEAASGAPQELVELDSLPNSMESVNRAILSRRPFAVSDLPSEVSFDLPEDVEEVELHPGLVRWKEIIRKHYRAYLAVPLIIKDELYGALVLYYLEPREFSGEDIGLGMALGGQVALAIESAQLYAQTRRRADEIETLFNVQQAITSRLDPDAVLQLIADEARRLTEAEQSAVYTLQGEAFEVSVVSGAVPKRLIGYRLPLEGSTAGLAVRTGRPFLIPDAAGDARVYGDIVAQTGARSFLIVPLMTGEGPIGTITVANKQGDGSFDADDERELTVLASSAVIALENARLYREEQERRHESERRRQVAETLRGILAVLNSDQPLDEILDYIVGEACRLAHTDTGAIYRLDEGGETLSIQAGQGLSRAYVERMRIPVGAGVVGRAVVRGRPVAIPDVVAAMPTSDELFADPERAAFVDELVRKYRAILAVPLVVKDEIYGGLVLYFPRRDREFSDEEIDLAVAFADQAALAIENARLRAQAEESAVAAERNRLARDLHDAVTQTLFSASLIAEVLPILWDRNPQQGRERLGELRELTRGALAEMRTLLLELRPATLVEAEMGELLRQLSEAVIGRARLPIDLQVTGGGEALPPDVQVALYRIVQEALNNVVKHAGASSATVVYDATPEAVSLVVRDDGRGFDPGAVSADHLGVGIMEERAEAIGASFELRSAPGEGSRIAVRWSRK
jgi:PAS domain S-box-containing protein